MIAAKRILMHPISKALCQTYTELYSERQVSFPLHDAQREAIDAVVKTVNANYFGIERFKTPREKAAAYLCFIIKDHPVTDGNKRLAILWFEIFCEIYGLKPDYSRYSLDEMAVAIEKAKLDMTQLLEVVEAILFPLG